MEGEWLETKSTIAAEAKPSTAKMALKVLAIHGCSGEEAGGGRVVEDVAFVASGEAQESLEGFESRNPPRRC